jgi:hypothetical protein
MSYQWAPRTSYDRPPLPHLLHNRGISLATAKNTHTPNPNPQQSAQIAHRALQSALIRLTDPPVQTASQACLLSPVPINGNGAARISTLAQKKSKALINKPGSAGRIPLPKTRLQANSKDTVYATDSVSVISKNKSNSSRAGSKRDQNGDPTRTKDIPYCKLNSTEQDLRAIQSLNRSFMA